tara:strand:- start:246 stop:1673 length:1428 start_codon:yes stop_codon:yes gene_type:complete
MKNLKTIFASLLIIIIHQINLSAAELGTKQEYGLSFLGSYDYEEPKLMHLRSGSQADADQLHNLGILYSHKNAYLYNGYLTEFEFDSSYQRLTQTYWSNGTGTMDDIHTDIYNLRALYGVQLSEKLMLKSGLGHRNLFHKWSKRYSSTGHYGYDRHQYYNYIPIIAELDLPIPELNIDGRLTVEFDHIFEGNNTSYQAWAGGTNKDKEFENNDGYMWKTSFEARMGSLTFEPYYEFMSVQASGVTAGSYEPSNTTKEFGLNVKKEFNSNNRTATNDYKKLVSNDEFYFGTQILLSEVESGFNTTTGTGRIDESDTGYSIVSGIKILDATNNLPIRLDVEAAFNQFGESKFSCNNGDTVKTDGRYQTGYDSGDTLTCSATVDVVIESYSTSIGIKPSFEIYENLSVNANLGMHRWDQSELTVSAGSATAYDYDGIDSYKGIGLSYNSNNISLAIEYLEHNMYYGAESMAGSIKYNF